MSTHSEASKMSRDRVHFTIPAIYLIKRSIRECIEETLGIRSAQSAAMGNVDQDMHIICRPSQFARFVVLRHVKYHEQNNMACLNMKLVLPDPPSDVIDVSRNPNTAEGTNVIAEGAKYDHTKF